MVRGQSPTSKNSETDKAKLVLASAFRALARRDHSEAELVRKLAAKGFSPAVVEDAITRLKEAGYLDDRRFARQWAESALRNGRGYGPRIRQELVRRGVAEVVVAEAMAGLTGEYGEAELIREQLARKFPAFSPGAAPDREKRRIMQYLQRRGFACSAIQAVFQGFDRGC
jgi:regulatory protein